MKSRFIKILTAAFLLTSLFMVPRYVAASSDQANVEYRGHTDGIVITPEDKDLFLNFKNVMPGDTRVQHVRIANESTNIMPARIYLRAEVVDEQYVPFLEQLTLQVVHNQQGELSLGAASLQKGLAEDVLLGTYFPGTENELEVTLQIPLELSNEYQNTLGEIVWVFTVVEDDPPPLPQTGLASAGRWTAIALILLGSSLLLIVWKKRRIIKS